MWSNLDVSIGDTERWVGARQQVPKNTYFNGKMDGIASIDGIGGYSIAPYFVTSNKSNHSIFRGQSPKYIKIFTNLGLNLSF